jgi:hypothetical protein
MAALNDISSCYVLIAIGRRSQVWLPLKRNELDVKSRNAIAWFLAATPTPVVTYLNI